MVDEDKLVEHPLPSLWLTNIITKLLGPVHFQLNCSESVFLPKTHPVMIFQYNSAMQYLFSGLVTVGSLSSVKTELRARCNLWKKKKNISCHISSVLFFSAIIRLLTATFMCVTSTNRMIIILPFICALVCEFSTWLVCSQYLKRGSLTLGITSLYTMSSASVVSRDKATPTQSITNRPEKCLMPICSVWRDTRGCG